MGVEQRRVLQLLLSGPSKLEGRTPGLMRRCSPPLPWLSCCAMYLLSSSPTCSWSLNGLGRKLERNQARYWEDRAKKQLSKAQSVQHPIVSGGDLHPYNCVFFWRPCCCVSVSQIRPNQFVMQVFSGIDYFLQRFLIRESPESQDFPRTAFLLKLSVLF